MCRRRNVHCFCLVAFGAGMLVGQWLESGFWCIGGGFLLICAGLSVLLRR